MSMTGPDSELLKVIRCLKLGGILTPEPSPAPDVAGAAPACDVIRAMFLAAQPGVEQTFVNQFPSNSEAARRDRVEPSGTVFPLAMISPDGDYGGNWNT
jgi:hypothetical protein